MESLRFGIVAEGPSDVAVLRNIIRGYRQDKEETQTEITRLQPANNSEPAGWARIWKYCASERFRDFFKLKNNRAVIQIDTDCCQGWGYKENKLSFDPAGLSSAEIVEKTKLQFERFFVQCFGADFLEHNKHKIIYAISVHSIECWLLPLDMDIEHSHSEVEDCHALLGKPKKEYQRYWELSSALAEKTNLESCGQRSESLQLFIKDLELHHA